MNARNVSGRAIKQGEMLLPTSKRDRDGTPHVIPASEAATLKARTCVTCKHSTAGLAKIPTDPDWFCDGMPTGGLKGWDRACRWQGANSEWVEVEGTAERARRLSHDAKDCPGYERV
jgi:hypothetical protein